MNCKTKCHNYLFNLFSFHTNTHIIRDGTFLGEEYIINILVSKGYFTKYWKSCHHFLTFMSSQNCMTTFLQQKRDRRKWNEIDFQLYMDITLCYAHTNTLILLRECKNQFHKYKVDASLWCFTSSKVLIKLQLAITEEVFILMSHPQ